MNKLILGLTFTIATFSFTAATAVSQGRSVRYEGEVMSADFKGDIREFLQSIAKTSGLEVRLDPAINRTVTVHLKDIPWDLALDTALKSSGLASESDDKLLRIANADPSRGQNRLLMGTTTIEGKVTAFQFQNPRAVLQVNALDADGKLQNWRVEWESADDLTETGIRPNMLKPGDQVIITGSAVRPDTLRLISIKRPGDGLSWGVISGFSYAPSDGLMFVSSSSR